MPGLYNQEVAEFPGLESWFLTAMVYGPKGTGLPLFGRYIVNGDRKLKLRILLTYVGDFAFKLLMDPFQEFVCWHFTEGKDSEPSTLDSQSSTTLFLSSEEPGPSTAALPSPSSSCEPQAFSPGPSALPSLLPPPLPTAPPGSSAPRRAGLFSVVAASPEAAPRLVDWLPGCPSATPPGVRGDERERTTPSQGPERGFASRPGAVGREEGAQDASTSPPPCAPPTAPASLEANVGDILVELRTMNGHLDVIARALTKLASSLGPQPQPLPDAPDAN